jgi:hypothetical protein
MAKPTINFRARESEVPIIGQFTHDSLVTDSAAFLAYKPTKYVALFITNLAAKILAVMGIIFPKLLTAELKVITLRMYTNVLGLRLTMNYLEGYVEDAVGLTIGVADFGIKQVRKAISSLDMEGLDAALQFLLTNIGNNMAALVAQGYTPIARAALIATKQSIFDDNPAQNAKEEERASLVVANIDVINNLGTDLKAIWKDGKHLYSITDKVKVKNYTNSQLVKRVRHDELHTFIGGVVKDKFGVVQEGAKIVARPVLKGLRGKTVKSGAGGVYEIDGLKPTEYNLFVTLENGDTFLVQAAAVTNQHTVVNLAPSPTI